MLKIFSRILWAFLLLSLMNPSQFFPASNGTIRGFVKDKQTGEALPYASVFLAGTSLGDAADKEGHFIIRGVPAGDYILRTTFVGYKPEEIQIKVEGGKTLELEINLSAESILNEDVIVTAQAEGQMHAINEQLSSLTIKNVVSLARIQELPDANAAESVGRLPGVSIIREGGEGSKVVIRGLSPQYNQITIDGVEMPGNVISNDPERQTSIVGDRAANLSMISSSMLGGIEVVKSITPDMDAAVIGGVVNFGLRKAVKGSLGAPAFELQTQGSYNDLKSTYDDYLFVGSYEQRYWDESFGLFLQGTVEKRNRSSNNLGASYDLKDKTHGDTGVPDIYSVNLTDVFSIKKRQGATLILDYAHSDGEIAFMNFLSTSNTNSVSRRQSILEKDDIFYSATDSENKLNVITNLLSIKQEIPFFHVDLKLSHTYSESHNPKDVSFLFWQDDAKLSGKGDLSKLHPKALAAMAVPIDTIARLETINSSGNFSADRAFTFQTDFLSEYTFSDFLTVKFKFGGMYQYRKRSYELDYGHAGNIHLGGGNTTSLILDAYPDMRVYGSTVSVTSFIDKNYSFDNFLNGEYAIHYPIQSGLMRSVLGLIEGRGSSEGYQTNKHGSVLYDYFGSERKSAAYAMATINLGTDITIVPGFRYQNLTTEYHANRGLQVPGGFQSKDTTVTTPHGYWLPMLHIRYKPLDWLQIHFAYTNTLNYPDYNVIIPRFNVTYSSIYYNNYLLKPATSENFDLVFSVYSNEIGLFTVNGFKKKIKDLVFESKTYISDLSKYPDLPQGTTQLYDFYTYINNPIPIDVYGVELDWQTNFWYLPDPFSGLVFNINYTHIFSEASYPRSELNIEYNPDGTFKKTVVDTFYTTRLLNQPNDILNFALGFDYGGFSGRLSMLYQDNIFKKPDFWMQNRVNSDVYIRWDLSLKQELPWYGIQLFLNLNNLTGEDDIDINQKNSFPVTQDRYGMTGDIGLRIRL